MSRPMYTKPIRYRECNLHGPKGKNRPLGKPGYAYPGVGVALEHGRNWSES